MRGTDLDVELVGSKDLLLGFGERILDGDQGEVPFGCVEQLRGGEGVTRSLGERSRWVLGRHYFSLTLLIERS